ncbi:hypothetical protein AYO21_11624 [Fonsecaea monophora]|uniref:Uncharacterized protein n=1 Tax=Fonsecaea monophora TaxID=254056 RepID=A0A177EQL2_9EURO|nr:hypothetical protein AYO21_11624 [Fonsecaea monophora]OAG34228.1 hypothetical protein AYO21_11624 [Fonsecaea monophora]
MADLDLQWFWFWFWFITVLIMHKNVTILVSKVRSANKREQVVTVIRNIGQERRNAHRIIVLADDDIAFAASSPGWILAPFEDDRVGGVEFPPVNEPKEFKPDQY